MVILRPLMRCTVDRPGPALDLGVLGLQVARGLVGEQGGDLAGQFAEMLGAEVGLAHQAQLVADQRVVDFDDLHGEGSVRAGCCAGTA